MSSPFIGEIRMFGGTFAPAGWAFCDGQLVPISENDTLFILLGTTFGGDGEETFGLPDLRGRAPMHFGTGAGATYTMGERSGVESVTLITQQIPQHNHTFVGTSDNGNEASPINNIPGASTTFDPYVLDEATNQMAAGSLLPTGGSQPHENMQPYLVISFIISLFGIFPSQT